MKRDMDLVRSILLEVEAAQRPLRIAELQSDGHSLPEVVYHVEIMRERGLIDASILRGKGGVLLRAEVSGLTWDGQDYLDATRDERVWDKARDAIARTVGSCTFETMKAVCVKAATDMAINGLQ